MATLGEFEYNGRVKIYWSKSGNIHTVSKHEQLDYEELCFENTRPEVLTTIDPMVARDTFKNWVSEFVS